MESHSNKAHEIEKDLHEHRQFPPEKGSKARIIQDYIEKESYLEHEARFTTLLWNIFAESLLLYYSKKTRQLDKNYDLFERDSFDGFQVY